MNYEFTTIVVTAAMADRLKQVSRIVDELESDNMFTTGLSATGVAPITHYISSGMAPAFYNRLLENGVLLKAKVDEVLTKRGMSNPYTQVQINNALEKCDISKEEPFAVIARLGLQLVNTEA